MFLHLGNDVVINTKDLIGIFDLELTSVDRKTVDFLKSCEQQKKVVNVSYEMPKTFVVCRDFVYITHISHFVLIGRLNKN